jgi:hypothetical protein
MGRACGRTCVQDDISLVWTASPKMTRFLVWTASPEMTRFGSDSFAEDEA